MPLARPLIFILTIALSLILQPASASSVGRRAYSVAQCHALQAAHPDIDLSSEFPTIMDQTDIGFCYAYVGADLLSYFLRKSGQLGKGENISALHLAIGHNEVEREENYQKFELYYGESLRELQTRMRQLESSGLKESAEWKETQGYFNSLISVAGPLLVEPTGDYVHKVINSALENGFCLEDEVPSSYIKNKDSKTGYVQFKPTLFEINRWPLADSEQINEFNISLVQKIYPLLSREQIREAYTANQRKMAPLTALNTIACQKRNIHNPYHFKVTKIDRTDVAKAMAKKNRKYTDELSNKRKENQNKPALSPYPSFEELTETPLRRLHFQFVSTSADPLITFNWPLLQEIDYQLDKKQPLSVALKADFLNYSTPKSLIDKHHAVLIVGRKLNCQSGQYEYLIRNSWGPQNCEQSRKNFIKESKEKTAPFRCSQNGYIWLDEEWLHTKIDTIIAVETDPNRQIFTDLNAEPNTIKTSSPQNPGGTRSRPMPKGRSR